MMDERYLDLLAEECAEVIQAIMKIKRFGIDDKYTDGRTGKDALLDEIGDVLCVLDYMKINEEGADRIEAAKNNKVHKLKRHGPDGSYFQLHHTNMMRR